MRERRLSDAKLDKRTRLTSSLRVELSEKDSNLADVRADKESYRRQVESLQSSLTDKDRQMRDHRSVREKLRYDYNGKLTEIEDLDGRQVCSYLAADSNGAARPQ